MDMDRDVTPAGRSVRCSLGRPQRGGAWRAEEAGKPNSSNRTWKTGLVAEDRRQGQGASGAKSAGWDWSGNRKGGLATGIPASFPTD